MPEKEKKKALVIGISEYDKLYPPLKFCENDVYQMVNSLSTNSLGYEITKLVGKVSWIDLRAAVRRFFVSEENIGSKDTLLFYFSGHGVMDRHGHYYLASSELDPSDPGDKGFDFDDLEKYMQDTISNRIVAILDCCHSGAIELRGKRTKKGIQEAAEKSAAQATQVINKKAEAVGKTIRKIRSGKGIVILSACLNSQEAESTTKGDASIFTKYLVQGLGGIDNDYVDKYGNVTTSLLGNYVYDKVTNHEPREERPKQIPIIKTELSGDIILAYYPDKIKQEEVNENEVLLKLLQQGKIADFNKKYEENPYRSRDLHEADLAKADLKRANLIGVNFAKANLEGAELVGVNLRGVDLRGANLGGANLRGVNLEKANLEKANLEKVNLRGAYLWGVNLEKANLIEANLWGAYLRGAYLWGANLEKANLEKVNLIEANLRGVNLEKVNLIEVNLEKANLIEANLRGVNLEKVNLIEANLWGANLIEANLRGVNLEKANLIEANLRGVNLSGADLSGAKLTTTTLKEADLRGAKNLPISIEEAKQRGAII